MQWQAHRPGSFRWVLGGTLAALLMAHPAAGQRVEVLAGWSQTERQSYGFLSPQLSLPAAGGNEWVARGTISWLDYDFVDATGHRTTVRSPGVAAGVAYRWIEPRTILTVGPGYEVRRVEESRAGSRSERTDHGLTLHGDLHYQATEVISIGASAAYLTVNDWTAVTGMARYRLGGRGAPVVGVEVTTQGNPQIRALGAGGLLETPLAGGTAAQLRAGFSRVRHASGLEETQPYYSVGIVSRL